MEMDFYRCAHCGQIVAIVKNKGVPIVCCGEKMQKLEPGTTDAAAEKHVPVVKVEGGVVTVTVGEDGGVLSVTSVKYGEADSLTVTNEYAPAPVEKALEATKELNGGKWPADGFEFTLAQAEEQDGVTMPGTVKSRPNSPNGPRRVMKA